jgi:hypothetical protein
MTHKNMCMYRDPTDISYTKFVKKDEYNYNY